MAKNKLSVLSKYLDANIDAQNVLVDLIYAGAEEQKIYNALEKTYALIFNLFEDMNQGKYRRK